jgi:hypothetical protein
VVITRGCEQIICQPSGVKLVQISLCADLDKRLLIGCPCVSIASHLDILCRHAAVGTRCRSCSAMSNTFAYVEQLQLERGSQQP